MASSAFESFLDKEDKASILLVDDQPANLVALEAVLRVLEQGLVFARSGEEALRRLLNEDFALILMDIQMPGLSGIETAALIRGREKTRHIPIIFFTAHVDADLQELRGYSLGAVDYLVKPIGPDVLRAKVQVFVELFQKTEQVKRQAAQLLEHNRREHERQLAEAMAKAEEARRRTEMDLARQVQQRLFPTGPFPAPGFEVGGASFPADATGGDYYDFIPMIDGHIGVVIGDVCGHGLPAALLMAETRALLWGLANTHSHVGPMLGSVNRMLNQDTAGERFVTLFFACLDPQRRSFTYASAGHTSGYVLNSAGEVVERLGSTAPALGILSDVEIAVRDGPALAPGEMLLLLTDGIEEACDPSFNAFGCDRALEVVRACRSEHPQMIIQRLYQTVREFSGTAAQADDMTSILIRRRCESQGSADRRSSSEIGSDARRIDRGCPLRRLVESSSSILDPLEEKGWDAGVNTWMRCESARSANHA
jgi:serine phosphatase RsbU (regulator of sigma subunit)